MEIKKYDKVLFVFLFHFSFFASQTWVLSIDYEFSISLDKFSKF